MDKPRLSALQDRFVAKLQESAALRYLLAPVCIAVTVLLNISALGPFLHPTALFLAGVVAAAWFGGAGPGFLAALLATLVLPQLISMSYPLAAGFFDLPRFLAFGLTAAAVGWGTTSRRRVEEALRRSELELRNARSALEATVAERTAALRLSEQRYARAMEGSDAGQWDWDLVTDEMYVSPRASEMLALPAQGVPATRAEIMALVPMHPDDRREMHGAVRAGITAGRHERVYRVIPRSGEVRWLQSRGKVYKDAHGTAVRMTGSLADITQRKLVEEALRLSEERYARAMEAAHEGHWEWNIPTDEIFLSERFKTIVGLPPGAQLAGRKAFLSHLPVVAEDRRRLLDTVDAILTDSPRTDATPGYEIDYRVCPRPGEVRWVRSRGKVFRDAHGKPVRMSGSTTDITDRKQAEEKLRQAESALRRAHRLEATGTLAGGIAHDFNNILGAILGYGEMALRDAPKGSRLRRDLDSITTAGERGRALVDRILTFSRSGVGERVAVHVEKVVREALDLLAAKLPPGIAIEAQLHAGQAAMRGDPTQVHQVLMNLGTNAVQAMSSGGRLSVSLDARHFDAARPATIGTLAAGDYVVLEVSDSGAGIQPEIADRIFDPFFTTKDVGVGTGLGLSLVHGIVTEVGGAIDVTSTPGAGSSFTVYFPRYGDAADCTEDDEPAMPRGNRQRVLIVDDEEPLVRLASRTLEELGYVPLGFTSSATALAAFRADPQRFDALITDERMPGMSGSALIREVRGIRGSIPVMLMSGFVGGAVSARARDAGADEVLKKPLSARELATSLARVLQPQ
jgi:PAS domain S-box-containing protein